MDRRIRDLLAQPRRRHEVVDAPARIRIARLAQVRPPRVDARAVRVERAERVDEARIKELRELAALLIREARIVVIRLRVLEVDLRVRDIEVAADDDRLLRIQSHEVRAERILPLHAVSEALEAALRVRRVDRHEVAVGELQCDHTALVVVLLDAEPIRDRKRLDAREDGRARIALALRAVPVLAVARQVKDGLLRLHLCLLQREDIRIELHERLHEALLEAGPKAIDIPGNALHRHPSSSRQRLEGAERPEDEHSLALDELVRHEADIGEAAVLRVVAVIAHDKDRALRHRRLRVLAARRLEDVVLREHLVVDKDAAALDLDRVARRRDDALDEVAARVARILEDEDLALLRRAEVVDELIDDEALLRLQRRPHRRAVDDVELDDELTDDEGQHDRDDNRYAPVFCLFS